MKSLATLCIAITLIIFCSSSLAANKGKNQQAPNKKENAQQTSLQQWYSYYYRDKNTKRIAESINKFAADEMLNKPTVRSQYVAFYAQLFKQDPDQMSYWMQNVKTSSLSQQAVIWQALWQSNTPQAKKYLQQINSRMNSETVRNRIALIKATPPINYLKKPVKNYNDVAALWGNFFATGNKAYINKIITVLNWTVSDKNKSRLNTSFLVRFNLATYAQQHPIVFNALQDALKKAKGKKRDAIERILKYADMHMRNAKSQAS